MLDELHTSKLLLKTIIPKQMWKESSLLKESSKKFTNLEMIDKLVYRLEKQKVDYKLFFQGKYLVVFVPGRFFAVKVYRKHKGEKE